MKSILPFIMVLFGSTIYAQTLNDGLMMPRNYFCTGILYTHDRWNEYWEGERRRDNENIGTLTTRSLTYVGNYGISDRLNVIVMAPYVRTEASAGTLKGIEGLQDLTVGAKYNFFRRDYDASSLRTFAVAGVSVPLTQYTPDYFPLSLGTATTNVFYRATAYYKFLKKFYVNGSAAYTWRSNARLDRPSYFTNDRLYLTNEVKMPDVFDYNVSIGFLNRGFQSDIFYMQQNTLGGSDIRRQDMPFVSNRMNASRVGALIMYYLPKPHGLALRSSVSHTVAGRNSGASTTLMGGLLYTINFSGNAEQ